MIIYTNGDSHTAAAEAVNPYSFAKDDPALWYMGDAAHPDNIKVSYGAVLGRIIKAKFMSDAISGSSNDRIIRTTKEFLSRPTNDKVLVVIGWSTWERVEWQHEGSYYQISAWASDDWPAEIKERHKSWVSNIDMRAKLREEHEKIWQFHLDLNEMKVKHLFFNSFQSLSGGGGRDWGDNYLFPYHDDETYYRWALAKNFKPVREGSYHFDKSVQYAWAQRMLPFIVKLI